MKALITDLDDTLWRGILGETGIEGLEFTLEGGAQILGLYQQYLQALAERGVLLAVASKNEAALMEKALLRPDLLVEGRNLFPVEANWGPKSVSVGRILKAWNIGADAVAFVDDSPMELAEVNARFPEIRTLQFPAARPEKFGEFLLTLREWFGRAAILAEDRLRAESIRNRAEFVGNEANEEFLAQLNSRLVFSRVTQSSCQRSFELVNKTNQFNMNGQRFDLAGWMKLLSTPGGFAIAAEYTDKFGPLGTISVVCGRKEVNVTCLHTWVMSCRAFSRRIEYAMLRFLFERLQVERIVFEYVSTPKNTAVRLSFRVRPPTSLGSVV
ncbi:MAG: HAD-IIIC family phosphatase [Bryobacteraceae bacterium]